jgi:adenylate cyclase
LGHPFSQLLAWGQGAKVYGFRGEPQRLLEAWAQVDQLAATHNLPMHDGENLVWRGWALGQMNANNQAVALIRKGIENLHHRDFHLNKCLMAALLAETQMAVGDITAAYQTLKTAIVAAAAIGEDYFRSELYRLLGHCLLEQAKLDEASNNFQQALEMARQQQAKSLELRAAMSLSRLWMKQNKRLQAYELLLDIYNWFTEGFDTADLRQAKELLLSLSP